MKSDSLNFVWIGGEKSVHEMVKKERKKSSTRLFIFEQCIHVISLATEKKHKLNKQNKTVLTKNQGCEINELQSYIQCKKSHNVRRNCALQYISIYICYSNGTAVHNHSLFLWFVISRSFFLSFFLEQKSFTCYCC